MPAKSTQSKHSKSAKLKKVAKPNRLKQAIRSNYARGGKSLSLTNLQKLARKKTTDSHPSHQPSQTRQPCQNRQVARQSEQKQVETDQTQAQKFQSQQLQPQPSQSQQLNQVTQLDVLDSVLSQVEAESASNQPGAKSKSEPKTSAAINQPSVKSKLEADSAIGQPSTANSQSSTETPSTEKPSTRALKSKRSKSVQAQSALQSKGVLPHSASQLNSDLQSNPASPPSSVSRPNSALPQNLNPGLVGQALPQASQYQQQATATSAGRVTKEQGHWQQAQQTEAQSALNNLEALSGLESQDGTGIEVVGSSQAVEQEPSPELSPEVEKYIKKVKNNQIQPPEEVVVANQDTAPTSQSQYVSKPVIVLPITPQLEKKGHHKPPKFSIRWLVAWSEKIMKKFVGEVVYRQPASQPAGQPAS